MEKLRVLIVDDSALMRQIIASMLASDPHIEVVGSAANPNIAREKIKALDPDVITLDIEMPEMDGIEFLCRLMRLRPMRVLMLSSLTGKNTEMTLRALEIGAVDCLEKPLDHGEATLEAFRRDLLDRVHAVGSARLARTGITQTGTTRIAARPFNSQSIIAIGASTGGVEALGQVMASLPASLPPIFIVQHMPAKFTPGFARRLDQASALRVREAIDGLEVHPGEAVIAPGGFHLGVKKSGGSFRCRLEDGESVSGHRPSADVLFHSAAREIGNAAVGVILTGMGRDGAEGLLDMRNRGAWTIGQDERTSLIYGMPRVAFEAGAVCAQLPLQEIAGAIVEAAAQQGERKRA
ncbi:MAG: chemotaxis response regulator protein-glutamate methylesterase [Proteobacteria bacterium]|nr:chemotaxis response regulator protein-glutamate methylesterase [Pseudomonadota bacterium]